MTQKGNSEFDALLPKLCRELDNDEYVENVVKTFLRFFADKFNSPRAEVFVPAAARQYALRYVLKGDELHVHTIPFAKLDGILDEVLNDGGKETTSYGFGNDRTAVIAVTHDGEFGELKNIIDNACGSLISFTHLVSLLSENKSLTHILESMPSCVFVCDTKLEKIYFANKNMRDLLYDENGNVTILNKLRTMLSPTDEDNVVQADEKSLDFYCETKELWLHLTQKVIQSHYGATMCLISLENITDKIQYEKVIEKQTLFDSRTGLPNRKQLDLDFQDIIRLAENDNENGMMLFIDIDNFKIVNDRFGHQYGDIMLREIGSFLSGLSKLGAQSYAFGGDEFLILIPHLSINNSAKIIDEILKRFNESWTLDDVNYTTSVSVGTALFPRDGSSLGSLLQKVDMSVYKAKIDGKGRLIEYRDSFANSLTRYMDIVREMRSAVLSDCDGFYVAYQPIVSAKTTYTESVEALLRWHHNELGNISPGEFIPIAEDTGLIIPLGRYVMVEAMKKCREWCDIGYIKHMNINLSVEQMIRVDFLKTVGEAVAESSVDPKAIVFEITESIAIKDLAVMNEIIGTLRRMGFNIALDDFGTGYSSFNCFKDLQLGIVKLDKTFIDNVSKNSHDKTMVRSIVNLSHDFDLSVCAEGVEQNDQYDILKDMGVDLIQGYLFSKPQEAHILETGFLKSHTPTMTN